MPAIELSSDHHIHTCLCNHAQGTMEEYVQAAINNGLLSITFLEHLECRIIYPRRTWLKQEHFTEYFRQGKRLQQLYADRITIRLGVEAGYNPAAVPQLRDMLSSFPFTHIGLSYHFYFAGNRHLNMVSRRQENLQALTAVGVDRVLDEYFTGLCRAIQELPCHKICHLDAVLRHLPGLRLRKRHDEQIEQLLILMQKKKIALEVNSSGLDIRSQPYPSVAVIKRAKALGIPLVAGSDAHRPDQVGRNFSQLPGLIA